MFMMNRGSFEHKLDSEKENSMLEISCSVMINIE